ncbi:MAG TPA: glycoside hydrolase family 5 protein [Oscillatoriales cyanobacterium M59_W2019_021]|nr:MAG: glycoside hydrolase family 5 protein [Cyanobacteria bacterium J055]HIK31407.1 glycoside hydrolase family 5 protein [Oscillatoriales cyanobacterium M4454_W2019_049]HIK50095.1 glycoside hydrolase family 5 protein [Oscillatoriales cyanobacterium M59_W2019_021]
MNLTKFTRSCLEKFDRVYRSIGFWLTSLHKVFNPRHQNFDLHQQWRNLHFSRLQSQRLRLGSIGLFATLLIGWTSHSSGATSPQTMQLPLSTRGSQIIDAIGQPVLLRGVNWFGLETETHAPHGLWLRDYKEMLAQIASLGYNTIRLPYSIASLRSESLTGIDFTIGANRELEGKTPLEVMDAIIEEAGRQNLTILLDSHRLNDREIPPLWYDEDYSEADWIETWKMLATRYKDRPHVIGADLKNEPHGIASWGTYDITTDWRLAAERAGNAILKIAPHWLIVVEGVENNVPGQQFTHWQGGNLEGVKRYPVRLSNPRQLVYSPHEYGAGVFDQPWFSEPTFPGNLLRRWEVGFHYIATEKIAPIWIGEFGGRQVDETSKEGIWQRKFVEFIGKNDLSFTYWSWNPNSEDTGGILLDDWVEIDRPKQDLLSQLLPASTQQTRYSVMTHDR